MKDLLREATMQSSCTALPQAIADVIHHYFTEGTGPTCSERPPRVGYLPLPLKPDPGTDPGLA